MLNRSKKKIKNLNACIYIKNKKILLTRKNNFGPLKGFLNVPIFENYSNNLQVDLDKFFKQKIKYLLLKKKLKFPSLISSLKLIVLKSKI